MERDRQQLQTQLESFHRQLDESRDQRDVTAAESRRLVESLSVAEQSVAEIRETLRQKVRRQLSIRFLF